LFILLAYAYFTNFDDLFAREYDALLNLAQNISLLIDMSNQRIHETAAGPGEELGMINFCGLIPEAYKFYPDFREKVTEMLQQKETGCYAGYINTETLQREIRV